MRFESKRDTWLVLFLRGFPVAILLVISGVWWAQHHDLLGPAIGVAILVVLELFFFDWVLRSTYYVIESGTLVIRSSFITWRVPIHEITRITPTRSAVSSPALSLDRLRIDYAGRWILVSPENKSAFVDALRAVNPAIIRAT